MVVACHNIYQLRIVAWIINAASNEEPPRRVRYALPSQRCVNSSSSEPQVALASAAAAMLEKEIPGWDGLRCQGQTQNTNSWRTREAIFQCLFAGQLCIGEPDKHVVEDSRPFQEGEIFQDEFRVGANVRRDLIILKYSKKDQFQDRYRPRFEYEIARYAQQKEKFQADSWYRGLRTGDTEEPDGPVATERDIGVVWKGKT
ncbi:hypothetical protein DFH07DRAFT_783821 [Mycena maculata]|uniref:Uncharacterized protein n=1 Tax=Mycena maculata TaxID=230809 RepID=A0AAD7HJY1_9AGAR|nr:hypothetical protein DFH07DRAFT_783821 [Mycena maculata]